MDYSKFLLYIAMVSISTTNLVAQGKETMAQNFSYWPKRSPLWEECIKLIREGKVNDARTTLEKEKQTKALSPECDQLLKEIQFNDLYDPNAADKSEYAVKRGDSLFSIAKKTKCSADYILAINNLKQASRLNIGDKLKVRELNMSLLIDVKEKKIYLMDKEVPVKEYSIKALRDTGTTSIETKITRKNGDIDGLDIAATNELFASSHKTLYLQGDLILKGTTNATAPQPGFFLSPEDANELALFLIVGNKVSIKR